MLCYSHLNKMAIMLNYLANNKNWVKAYTLEEKISSMPNLLLQHTFKDFPCVSFLSRFQCPNVFICLSFSEAFGLPLKFYMWSKAHDNW